MQGKRRVPVRDTSKAASDLRSKVSKAAADREGVREIGGALTPGARASLKRDSAKSDQAAYDAAIAYRKKRTGG